MNDLKKTMFMGMIALIGLAGTLAADATVEDGNEGVIQFLRGLPRKLGARYDYRGSDYCGTYSRYHNGEYEYEYCTSVCFPSSSTVMTETGIPKRMDELNIGDSIQVHDGSFEKVYAFGAHMTTDAKTTMVSIATESGKTISLSPSHWTYVSVDGVQTAVQAMNVREGQSVYAADGTLDLVEKVSTSTMSGLFNPMTASGTIVVDGVVASCYAGKSHPDYLHMLTTPARVASRYMSKESLAYANEIFGTVLGIDGVTVPSWLTGMDDVLVTITLSPSMKRLRA